VAYRVRRYTITNDTWVAIGPQDPVPGRDAFAFYNLNGEAMLLRADKDDPDTEWSLPANSQEVAFPTISNRPTTGEVLFWAKQATVGTSVAILKMP
jgi:hypothetical protein